MKIHNISPGKTFKNYKELCGVLEIPVKSSSKSKMYQLKELSRFCSYRRSGHTFIIDEVFEIPLDKVDNRGKSEGSRNNNNIYSNAIQLMITDLLAQCKGHISISRSRLQFRIGMTNENYSELSEYIRKLSNYTGIAVHVLYDFYNLNNVNFKQRIESALNILQDKSVIMYKTVFKIGKRRIYNQTRTATPDEEELIMECQKEILEEMGYKTLSEVPMKNRKKFRNKTQKLLNENSDIDFYYKAYDITINKKYIEKERNELESLLLEEVKRNEYKGELNETVIKHIVHNAEKRHEKENGYWGKTYNKKLEIRKSDTYIDDIKRLTNLLIDINTDNFSEKVKEFKVEALSEDLIKDIEQIRLFG